MSLQPVNPARKDLNERFTLVVITHNRPVFLHRTLEYYRSFAGKILVLDSSTRDDSAMAQQYPNVDYRHLPQFSYSGLQEKLTYGVMQVTTPFMAFMAVDDFILPGAIDQCVDFLHDHPDYGVCHGYGLMYHAQANEVIYWRRDLKVQEDYASDRPQERLMDFMNQFQPPFFSVVRTELLRKWYSLLVSGTNFEWQEVGHTFYLLACSKLRVLDITYIIRELNAGGSEHGTNVLTVLTYQDAKSVAEREKFAGYLASIPTGLTELGEEAVKQIALDSFAAMADCLMSGRSLKGSRLLRSQWFRPDGEPTRLFAPIQFVEMPFYNKPVFDQLTEIELLIHAIPAGREQLKELEGVLVRQHELLRHYPDDTPESVISRLRVAMGYSVFNVDVVDRLVLALEASGNPDESIEAVKLGLWSKRLAQVKGVDRTRLLADMFSGRLLKWLDKRSPNAQQIRLANDLVVKHGPRIEILLTNLDNDVSGLQATFDSLMACNLKTFKVVVLMTDDVPATTSRQDTVHFIKVSRERYVDWLNEVVAESSADWLLLVQAGVEFTTSGLLRAALELRDAQGCRAVLMDEVHRQEDGSLTDVFRPGFNLDLLLTVPDLMARHWLVRKDVLLDAGGYSAEFDQALEFNAVLKIIEQGGMAGLAHLAEPLLICPAPVLGENGQQSQVLTRHLQTRGYSAQVKEADTGVMHIDYRHAARPLVSIVLQCEDNFEQLQACLVSVLQRTRYQRHEILIADNQSQDPKLQQWLEQLTAKGDRVRVVRSSDVVNQSALRNLAAREAKGDYLLFLEPDGQVVNANWIDTLLNHAQRPEVGIVGARLVDEKGACSQGGLILGFEQGVGAALVGEGKGAQGYMRRLLVEQNCSAVSGACMMVRKELFDAVEGFDETVFGDHFADVDMCLKLGEAGYLVVWTPQAQVQHSGALPTASLQLEALRSKWPIPMQHDPAYNPNHLREGSAFRLNPEQALDWDQLLA